MTADDQAPIATQPVGGQIEANLGSMSAPTTATPPSPVEPEEDADTAAMSETIFTMVKASELYPLSASVERDDDSTAPVPFARVPGEVVSYLSETKAEGWVVVLSNYRLHISESDEGVLVLNVPLSCVESCEQRDLFYLHILCKDGRLYRIQLDTNAMCEVWHKRICQAASLATCPEKIQDVFAFGHYAWALETHFEDLAHRRKPGLDTWFRSEIARLRFDVQGAWRTSVANKDHRLSPTYPPEILVPACVSDACLEKVAQFRSAKRIPAVVWRHVGNGAVLARCSQPEVGWLGWRSADDEDLVKAIADACAFDRDRHPSSSDSVEDPDGIPSLKDLSAEAAARQHEIKTVLILDARSYAAAVGNRARGGGVECPEYYPNTEILFMNLANIHSIRKSFHALRQLCNSPADQTSWFQALDATKWLHHVSGLIKAAIRVATALDVEGRPVIVHCSDGWDRTPQITALAELMLDPYYRSEEGFQVLVEKEWLDFGHKFADRNGSAFCTSDLNERSPIFLQWLDCVHQLLLQFPCNFEFNLSYLVKLAQHTYSSLFGTFLCNSLMERKQHRIREQTRDVWNFLRYHPYKFRNLLYTRKDEILWPKSDVRDLLLWRDVYVSELKPSSSGAAATTSNGASSEQMDSGANNSRDESENEELESRNIALVKEELQKLKGTKTLKKQQEGNVSEATLKTEDSEDDGQNTVTASSAKSIQLEKVATLHRTTIETSTDTLVPESDVEERSLSGDLKRDTAASKDQQPNEDTTDSTAVTQEHPSTTTNDCQNIVENGASKNSDSIADEMSVSFANSKFEEPLDSDGLPAHHNEVQRRLVSIFSAHDAEVQHLKRDLYLTRMALCRNKLQATSDPGGGGAVGVQSLAAAGMKVDDDCRDGNGMGVINGAQSSASDASSWEAVDEKESKPTLWVPDHAASACISCHTEFWFGRRKHHCRNCGQVFCSECSDNLAPIPTEQLYHPVRICNGCFQVLYPESSRERAIAMSCHASTAAGAATATNTVDSRPEEGEATVILGQVE